MEGSDNKTRPGSGPPVSGYDPTPRAPFDAPMPVRPSLPSNVPAAGRAPAPAPADPLIGKLLADRYRVDRKLGEGGMGSVYLATHVALEKRVALKVLHPEFARKSDLVERFLLEAKAASRIRHENVIDISDFGATPDGTVFFAMEFLEGVDLHDLIARAKLTGQALPWKRARDIFLQVCAALSAAHGKGIVHRDLKPENIYLVDRAGMPDFVKLLDFGIAKMTEVKDEEGRKLTRTGMLFGTPEYMSPEQARGEHADHRVDIYAMGCILHQLITGEVPFQADNFMGILSLHLTEPPPVVTSGQLARLGAPPGLAAVVARALAKNRDERFQTMDEMSRALVDAERGRGAGSVATPPPAEAPLAEVAGRPKRTVWTGKIEERDDEPAVQARPARRGKAIWIVVALLIVGGAVGAYLLTRRGNQEDREHEPPVAVPETPAATPTPTPTPTSTSTTTTTSTSTSTSTSKPAPAPPTTTTTTRKPPEKRATAPVDKPATAPTDQPGEIDPADPKIGDVQTKDPFKP